MTRDLKPKMPGDYTGATDAVVESPEIAAYIAKQVAAKLDIELQKHNRSILSVNTSGLPHQNDVDPASITKTVLTQQGYVVPHGTEPLIK